MHENIDTSFVQDRLCVYKLNVDDVFSAV